MISLIFFYILITNVLSIDVFPKNVIATPGEGVVLQVLPVGTALQECTVIINGKTHTWPQPENSTDEQQINYWGGGLENGHCGAIVYSYNSDYSGKWTFKLLLKNETEYRVVQGNVTTGEAIFITEPVNLTAEVGKEIIIPCDGKGAFYCRLNNPNNEAVISGTNCTNTISNFKMADVGVWRCIVGVPNTVNEKVTDIIIKVHDSVYLEIGQTETETEVIIYCNHRTKIITFCRFERPDGNAYLLSEGRNIGRYTYFGRGISESYCGMSIAKPVTDEDLGSWKCTIGLQNQTKTGGFINLSKSIYTRKEKLRQTMGPQKIVSLVGQPLSFDCSTDTSMEYCWFKHPNGTRINLHPDFNDSNWHYHGDGLMLGQCGITVQAPNLADSGTWTCGMGITDETEVSQDLQKTFQVIVSEIPFVQNATVTTAIVGDWVLLGCHTVQGEALQFCSFIAPNGTGYNLMPSQSRGRLTYYGAGLKYGDCGLLINPVIPSDFGAWQCGTMLASSSDGQQLVRTLTVTSPSLMSSSAVGLLVGTVVATVMIVGFIIYRQRYRRSRPTALSQRPVALSTLSDGSDDVQLEIIPERH